MLYRNKFSKVRKTLDTKIARGFLNNMTIRQGKKFNDPKSKEGIRGEIFYLSDLFSCFSTPFNIFLKMNHK